MGKEVRANGRRRAKLDEAQLALAYLLLAKAMRNAEKPKPPAKRKGS